MFSCVIFSLLYLSYSKCPLRYMDLCSFSLPGEKDEEAKKLGILKEQKKESPYSLGNICWFIASVALFYYLDFPTACLYDPRVKRLVEKYTIWEYNSGPMFRVCVYTDAWVRT